MFRVVRRRVPSVRESTDCKVLGATRLESLSVHDGRHTFVSVALDGSRTLAEVRDAAGHTKISTTSCYLHVTVDKASETGSLLWTT